MICRILLFCMHKGILHYFQLKKNDKNKTEETALVEENLNTQTPQLQLGPFREVPYSTSFNLI